MDGTVFDVGYHIRYLAGIRKKFKGSQLYMVEHIIYPLMLYFLDEASVLQRILWIVRRFLFHELGAECEGVIDSFLDTLSTKFQETYFLKPHGTRHMNFNTAMNIYRDMIWKFVEKQKLV